MHQPDQRTYGGNGMELYHHSAHSWMHREPVPLGGAGPVPLKYLKFSCGIHYHDIIYFHCAPYIYVIRFQHVQTVGICGRVCLQSLADMRESKNRGEQSVFKCSYSLKRPGVNEKSLQFCNCRAEVLPSERSIVGLLCPEVIQEHSVSICMPFL